MGAGGALAGLGAVEGITDTVAFTSAEAPRRVALSVADDQNAIVGLTINDPVKKNNRELLVEIQNDTTATVDFTVSLDDCTQGTLYGPNGSGCSVGLTLSPGGSGTVDIEASTTGTIPFTVSGTSSSFNFEAGRTTTAESGNTTSAIVFKELKGFSVDAANDRWPIESVWIQDGDGDDDLDRVEYKVTDEAGSTVFTRTDAVSGGAEYKRKGNANNPGVVLQPDSYDVVTGETYTLTVTAYDADGNFDVETRDATA